MEKEKNQQHSSTGVGYAVLAFAAWGVLPIYWKAMEEVSALEILTHRIFWSFIFVFILLMVTGGKHQLKTIFHKNTRMLPSILSSLLISINWLIFIWAVNSEHIVETSLGYYINPLISIFLGMVVLRERLNFWQLLSLAFAMVGVLVITIQFGKFPWVALSLALTFGLYGLVKKKTNFEAKISLFLETLFVTPLALLYIVILQVKGIGSLGTAPLHTHLLFLGAGVVTALPLLWFAEATKRVPLSTIGFTQYLAPSISLLLGVLVYHEPFTKSHLITFAFIWFALVLYSFSHSKMMVDLQPKYFKRNVSQPSHK